MNIQFGLCNFDGATVSNDEFAQVRPALDRCEHDSQNLFCKGNVGILCQALYTTAESRLDKQPYVTTSGLVVAWDGRLDNRQDLIRKLGAELCFRFSDLEIVASAYERWGTQSFRTLIGDWAIAIWDSQRKALILAKDCIGTRSLYYSSQENRVTWSNLLEAMVQLAPKPLNLDEEYVAGWLSLFPAAHLTPYKHIHSVPPSTCVTIRGGRAVTQQYWDFDPSRKIRHRSDAEYEEHFRSVFSESVRRRLRDVPVVAELSGGIDSSSIVCVADAILKQPTGLTPRLDTVSYFNDSEPSWDERAFFTRVEEQRGRPGYRILVRDDEAFQFNFDGSVLQSIPGFGIRSQPSSAQLSDCIASGGNRVVLSGIGGDEVMGGIPTPIPELQDMLARARLKHLTHQIKLWALERRRPWFHLFFEAALEFLPDALRGSHAKPLAWLQPDFARLYRGALSGYRTRLRLTGALPSFQENMFALNMLRRQLGCSMLPSTPSYEKRYPYLDRDLLEFIYAIPREQLVRPGQRRSLMRRSLAGIVPDEVLNRRRKAFVARMPMVALSHQWPKLLEMNRHMIAASCNFVSSERVLEALQLVRAGREVAIVSLVRTLQIEAWLRGLYRSGVLKSPGNQALCPMDERNAEIRLPSKPATVG